MLKRHKRTFTAIVQMIIESLIRDYYLKYRLDAISEGIFLDRFKIKFMFILHIQWHRVISKTARRA